ncbi:RNA recognition motif domain protein [Metarhizium album ARSEF 1941]|uniref:RNA recognition motif domain protein n=1 Tax=Metarhizium album (strain ARSEF 1941) TaxID=1081103 RepID=A0A0B2X6J9_METAS|nr:RNA recognition motif domain protein [Metarhizium album ARSEF 1941]KHO02019.1 RNA recognition motif domain protein [Metarhizium album ARSEF 1941]
MSEAARWKATVFVGGLSFGVTTTDLLNAFIPFGEIVEVQIPKPDSRKSMDTHRGFAYVEFEDPEDAKEAIDNMDQSEFFGKVLKVSQAKAPKSADEGLGSRKAVWEQESWLAEHAAEEQNGASEEPAANSSAVDPMQGLEGLDVAGPKPV